MSLIPFFNMFILKYKCTKKQFVDIKMICLTKIFSSPVVYIFDVEIKSIQYEIVVIFICIYDQIYV